MPIINPANITNLDNGRCDHLDVLSELFNSRVLMLSGGITPAVAHSSSPTCSCWSARTPRPPSRCW